MRLNIFVNISHKLVLMSSLEMRQMRAATASLHLRYVILWYFFINTDSGVDVLLKTDSLSHNISKGPSSGTLNMCSLYCNTITNLTVILRAVNSENKPDVLNKLCFLLIHITGAQLQNIILRVCYHLVTLSDAWSTSSKQCVYIGLPFGCVISSGITFFASW